ncbi:VOC family protein [Saccharothrix deserti]|uniref:VOC family protein n=1 Tax=Saccharothrix deserti TaxID=2593674 RepID=UPI00131B9C45|nr:VOC family protein [Saccharothrix deserti]
MVQHTRVFSSFAVNDAAKAKDFYEGVLGLRVTEDENGLLSLNVSDDTWIMVYPKEDHVPATFTVLNLEVEDIDRAVDDLTGRGVRFERYEGMETDEKGIYREWGPAIAWFTDPSGNVMAVVQRS